ncbi:MAG: FAD-dependent oxidoreductase, partial [Bacteroidota bacterium]
MTDVIIIGAGLAGLNAARNLEKSGKTVLVLEARSRLGGRNLAQVLEDGNVLEMGGQWIGPSQTRIYELCKELELELYPTYNEGKNLFYLNGKRKPMKPKKDALPPFNVFELLDLDRIVKKIRKMTAEIDLKEPWKHPKAKEWDQHTYETWIQCNPLTARTKEFLRIFAEAVFSAESADFSFLHFLFYVKAGVDIETLSSVDRGAQQERVIGGTQLISKRIAASLKNEVELNCPIDRIEQNENGITVYSGKKSWSAKKVIVAIPPTLAGRISYEPPMPPNRDQLTQRIPMGTVIKIQVLYKTPFWRKEGWTG